MEQPMFTVKHVRPDGGADLWPAVRVSVQPSEKVEGMPGFMSPPDKVEFDVGDGTGVRGSIDNGVVYVMNANGKTVDTYNLPLKRGSDMTSATKA